MIGRGCKGQVVGFCEHGRDPWGHNTVRRIFVIR